MEGKLIKLGLSEGYRLDDLNGNYIASTLNGKNKLSLENCESIVLSYDFDEYQEGVFYAGQFGHPSPEGFSDEQVGRLHGFIDGFQKALEILGDKKFSEDDMKKAMLNALEMTEYQVKQFRENNDYHIATDIIQSLQPAEWDVEIEMEDVTIVYPDGENEIISQPRLDKDGCLILKRK